MPNSPVPQGLQKVGGALFLYGVLSAVLWFVHMNLIILMWMDFAGVEVGWAIRGGMIVGGAIMFGAGKFLDKGDG